MPTPEVRGVEPTKQRRFGGWLVAIAIADAVTARFGSHTHPNGSSSS